MALYEGLWAVRPFPEDSLRARLAAVAGEGPTPPAAGSEVPRWVWPVLRRGLADDPGERWPGMDALLDALETTPRRRERRRRRQGVAAALGLTAIVAGFGGAVLWRSEPEDEGPVCAGVEHELDDVWGDDARAELERAFAATGLGWAAEGSQRVITAVDQWSEGWLAARLRLCRARHEGADELLMAQHSACLVRRRAELGALVEVLGRPDAAAAQEALAAVGELGDPAECLDDLAVFVPGPAPPTEGGVVGDLDERLTVVEALIRTGQYAGARAALEQLEAPVEATGHEPLRARLLELRGRAELSEGELELGFASLLLAADLAEASRDDLLLASAWRFLALYAMSEANDVVDVWTHSYRGAHPNIGNAHILLAGFELGAARLDAADAQLDLAAAVFEVTRPPEHPDLGDVASARAAVAFARGDFEGARVALDRVIGIYAAAFGLDDPYLAKVRAERGWVLLALGEVDEAEADLVAADAVLSRSEDLGAMRESSLLGLTVVALSRREHERARAVLEAVAVEGRAAEDLADHHLWSAVLHWRLGDPARARDHLASGEPAVAEATRTRSLAAAGVSDELLEQIRTHR